MRITGKDFDPGVSVQNPHLIAEIIDFINPLPHEKILDFGCGRGVLTVPLAAKADVCGIDMEESSLEAARAAGLKNLSLFAFGNGSKLSFPDGLFDTIVCFHVLEHFDPQTLPGLLGELRRTLRKGGRLIVGVPIFGITARAIYLVRHLLNPLVRDHFGSVVHRSRFTRRALGDAVRGAGFTLTGKSVSNIVVQDKLRLPGRKYYRMLYKAPLCLDILVEARK